MGHSASRAVTQSEESIMKALLTCHLQGTYMPCSARLTAAQMPYAQQPHTCQNDSLHVL